MKKLVLTAGLLLASSAAISAEPTTVTVTRGGVKEVLSCTATGCTKQEPAPVARRAESVSRPPQPSPEVALAGATGAPARLLQECRREYGTRGDNAVYDCVIHLGMRALTEIDNRRINGVYDRANPTRP